MQSRAKGEARRGSERKLEALLPRSFCIGGAATSDADANPGKKRSYAVKEICWYHPCAIAVESADHDAADGSIVEFA